MIHIIEAKLENSCALIFNCPFVALHCPLPHYTHFLVAQTKCVHVCALNEAC